MPSGTSSHENWGLKLSASATCDCASILPNAYRSGIDSLSEKDRLDKFMSCSWKWDPR
ncbi:Uncharacterised protein [Bordetella pertussis]|nr:Uncharacterised protein [Bordetella pertussis]CPL03827.1 Uncharacterised protein [Bordetella pertussis]